MSIDASDVTLAVLTGGRPDLLRRTLQSLPDGTLDTAHFIVMHNGADAETTAVLDEFEPDLRLTSFDETWPIGKATSHLLAVAGAEKRPFTMYLQDDWECRSQDDWLSHATQVLDDDPGIGQVRLRLTAEKTFVNQTSVFGEKVTWTYFDGHRTSYQADWVLNPFISRTEDLIFPITDEKDAMRRSHDIGKIMAQLVPGVFSHIGGKGRSLRVRMDKGRRRG